jgi:hypothetical protein
VPTTFWAYPFVEALAERGIIRGFADGTFKPDQPVNRAEFAAMLQSAFEQRPDQRTPQQFSDVLTGFWAVPAINKAYGTGFMEGYPGNVFRPEQPIPRVQAIVSLAKGLNVSAPANANQVVQTYQDANQIPDWATSQVAGATEAAIVVNHPNTSALEPNREATRAEVAALVYQALVRDNQAPPIDSQYIVRP